MKEKINARLRPLRHDRWYENLLVMEFLSMVLLDVADRKLKEIDIFSLRFSTPITTFILAALGWALLPL